MSNFSCARCGEMHPICDHHQPKTNPRLDLLLIESEQRGTAISAICEEKGGMASVRLMWQPYECVWIATCSWSGGSEIRGHSTDVVEAVDNLVDALAVEYRRLQRELL